MPEKTVFIGFLCTCGWVYRQLHSMLFPRRVMRMQFAKWLGSAGLALAVQACVVHDTTPVNAGYGYGYQTNYPQPQPQVSAGVSVGGDPYAEPEGYVAASAPP